MEHRTRLIQTGLLNITFMLTIGLVGGIFGPTLLDLTEMYGTTVDKIAFMFMMGSFGSIIGSFLTGVVIDKFPHYRCLIMCFYVIISALSVALMPFMKYLPLFFLLSFMGGFTGGSLDMGGNVFCLDIWKGLDGGPYLHSIHFSFAVGAFLGPILSVPFLNTNSVEHATNTSWDNSTRSPDINGIAIFYPIVGALAVLPAIGFLYYGIQDLKAHRIQANATNRVHLEEENPTKSPRTWNIHAMLGLMVVFFFLYVGAEVTFGNFLAVFGVESDLQLSKTQGADITAIFWGAFALMRFISIFAAMTMNPLFIMLFSFLVSVLSMTALSIMGNQSLLVLQMGSAGMGVGMASIFATGILWMEQYVVITNKIGSLVTISASLGPDIYPVIIGQYIVADPMILMHVVLATVIGCVIIFGVSHFILNNLSKSESLNVRLEADGFETIPLS